MALPVDVRSIDVLRAVREAFILFGEDARSALGTMDGEIRRCVDWLTHDQRIHWQGEIKRRAEKLSEAKAELHRKQLSQMFGEHAHDSEQRENVRDAKRRLEEAEDKLETVRRWLPVVDRAVQEYNGQARPFADIVEFDVERSVELLDRMIVALEEYMRLEAPQTAARPSASTAPVAAPIPMPGKAGGVAPEPGDSADPSRAAGAGGPPTATQEGSLGHQDREIDPNSPAPVEPVAPIEANPTEEGEAV